MINLTMWYPPPYEFEAYRDANVVQIKRAIKHSIEQSII